MKFLSVLQIIALNLCFNVLLSQSQLSETVDHDKDLIFYWDITEYGEYFNHFDDFKSVHENYTSYFPPGWSFDPFESEITTYGVWMVLHELTNTVEEKPLTYIHRKPRAQLYDEIEIKCYFSDFQSTIHVTAGRETFTLKRRANEVGWENFVIDSESFSEAKFEFETSGENEFIFLDKIKLAQKPLTTEPPKTTLSTTSESSATTSEMSSTTITTSTQTPETDSSTPVGTTNKPIIDPVDGNGKGSSITYIWFLNFICLVIMFVR